MKFKYYPGKDGGVLSAKTKDGEIFTFGVEQGAVCPKFWQHDEHGLLFRRGDIPNYFTEQEKSEIFKAALDLIPVRLEK